MFRHSTKGFTLTELLIALMLLSIVLTFTIPKVLHAGENRANPALIRETVAALESSYYTTRIDETMWEGVNFYSFIRPKINYLRTATGVGNEIDLLGNPLCVSGTNCVLDVAHPCVTAGYDTGWLQFPNGVIVTGLDQGPPDVRTPGGVPICIDINGPLGANIPGVDVFSGTFDWVDKDTARKFTWTQPAPGFPQAAAVSNLLIR